MKRILSTVATCSVLLGAVQPSIAQPSSQAAVDAEAFSQFKSVWRDHHGWDIGDNMKPQALTIAKQYCAARRDGWTEDDWAKSVINTLDAKGLTGEDRERMEDFTDLSSALGQVYYCPEYR